MAICRICCQPLVLSKSKSKKSRKSNKSPVVAAQCGDLFHRSCLHKYCSSSGHSKTLNPDIICPICGKVISVSRVRVIDITAHEGITCDKVFTKAAQYLKMMTKELDERFDDTLSKYEKTKRALQDLLPIVHSLAHHVRKHEKANHTYKQDLLTDIERAISEATADLNVVQEHNIFLARILLEILKEYPPETISKKQILPPELIPVIKSITIADTTLLQKIVNIIVPKPNGDTPGEAQIAEILSLVKKETPLFERLDLFYEDLKKLVKHRMEISSEIPNHNQKSGMKRNSTYTKISHNIS